MFVYATFFVGCFVLAVVRWPPPILFALTIFGAFLLSKYERMPHLCAERIVITPDALEWRHGWSLRAMGPTCGRIILDDLSEVRTRSGDHGIGGFSYAELVDRSGNRVVITCYRYSIRGRRMLLQILEPYVFVAHEEHEDDFRRIMLNTLRGEF